MSQKSFTVWTSTFNAYKIMTKKESKQLDFVLFMQIVASTRGADKTDMLNAFAFDMNLIREGKQPTASKELV